MILLFLIACAFRESLKVLKDKGISKSFMYNKGSGIFFAQKLLTGFKENIVENNPKKRMNVDEYLCQSVICHLSNVALDLNVFYWYATVCIFIYVGVVIKFCYCC